MASPKSSFLQIRFSAQDRARVDRASESQFLDSSTWARAVILKALAELEADSASDAPKPSHHKSAGGLTAKPRRRD